MSATPSLFGPGSAFGVRTVDQLPTVSTTGMIDKCMHCQGTGKMKYRTTCKHKTYCDGCKASSIEAEKHPAFGTLPCPPEFDVKCRKCNQWVKLEACKPVVTINRTLPAQMTVQRASFRKPSKTIRIHVGPPEGPKTIFEVHAHLLHQCSPFFVRGLSNGMKESSEQEFKSFEEDPSIFGLLVEFMYTGTIDNTGANKPTLDQYFSLWILGDFLENNYIMNHCAWSLLKGYDLGERIEPAKLADLYRATPKVEDKPMRKFIVDLCVWGDVDMRQLDDPPKELLLDMVLAYQTKGEKESPLNDVRNYYVPAGQAQPSTSTTKPVTVVPAASLFATPARPSFSFGTPTF